MGALMSGVAVIVVEKCDVVADAVAVVGVVAVVVVVVVFVVGVVDVAVADVVIISVVCVCVCSVECCVVCVCVLFELLSVLVTLCKPFAVFDVGVGIAIAFNIGIGSINKSLENDDAGSGLKPWFEIYC